ncbi:MAG: hypothetical protein WD768_17090 [Phycisphaeraceae bacterium]
MADLPKHLAAALKRYFRGRVTPLRPWSLAQAPLSAPLDPKRAITALKEARKRMRDMEREAAACFEQFISADAKLLNALRAEALIDAGFHIGRINDFALPDAGREGVRLLRDGQHAIIAEAVRPLERYDEVARLRMGGALRLLRLKFVSDSLGEDVPGGAGAVITRSIQLAEALYLISKSAGTLRALRETFVVTSVLLVNLKGNEHLPRLIRQIKAHLTQLHDRAKDLRGELMETMYPFNHEAGTISVGMFLCDEVPGEENIESLVRVAGEMIDRYGDLYRRTLANLASISEQV